MSDQGGSMPGGAPLTRRELREREQALAAAREEQQRAAERRATLERLARERAAQQSPPPPRPAPQARPAAAPVAPAPAAPAASPAPTSYPSPGGGYQASGVSAPWGPAAGSPPPAPAAPPARRSMRDGGQPAPVVRPPAGVASTRAVDATGRLMPVQPVAPTSAPPTTPPLAQPSAAPTRTSMRPAPSSGPVAPAAPAPAAPAPAAPAFGPTSGGPVPAFGATNGAPTAAPWASTSGASPAGPAAPAPSAPAWAVDAAPQAFPATVPGALDTPDPSAGYDPAATVVAPWGATGAEQQASATAFAPTSGRPAPVPGAASAFGEDVDGYEDDDEIEEPRHAYTWLHYLILVAVAFVLGLLIWQLIGKPSSTAPGTAAPAVTVLHDHSHDTVRHDPEGSL